MSVTIALTAFLMSNALASPPSPGELGEWACLFAKDGAACEAAYRRAEKSPDGTVFARVGCREAKSARSCAHLGDALVRERGAEADVNAAYEAGCSDESGLGCLRLLERMAAGAPGDAARADALVQRACDPRGGVAGQCSVAKGAADVLRRQGDKTLAVCQTEVQIFGSEGVTSKTQFIPEPGVRNVPRSRDECARECARVVETQYSADPTDLVARGRCRWGSTYLDTHLKSLAAMTRCPNDSQALGTSTDRLFARCRCESPTFEAANKLAAPFGAFVRAEVAYAKKFGKETWYRCGAAVRFDDESELGGPTCASTVAGLRKALGAEPSLRSVVLNFQGATCKGAKK